MTKLSALLFLLVLLLSFTYSIFNVLVDKSISGYAIPFRGNVTVDGVYNPQDVAVYYFSERPNSAKEISKYTWTTNHNGQIDITVPLTKEFIDKAADKKVVFAKYTFSLWRKSKIDKTISFWLNFEYKGNSCGPIPFHKEVRIDTELNAEQERHSLGEISFTSCQVVR